MQLSKSLSQKVIFNSAWIIGWFFLWCLTPGIANHNLGQLVTHSDSWALVISSLAVLIIVGGCLIMNLFNSRSFFRDQIDGLRFH
ncbi:hypothetical protein [Lentilactobacillus diolivorans]|uniref:Uncharacterized protein n=1 Tax=Lentilactobacillus diolivorans DSM 14421 TaxID=1423739 RepID=A0A0R1SD95_9LACO|nr:hypothetical protein [Lentilactobacillus diolivorans]KRL66526.1 hypothetical protein FC85_GL002833 [Lentilactobacillus diolivorans DSM 14421]